MKTQEDATHGAQEFATALGESVVVFQDCWFLPPFNFGYASSRLFRSLNPKRLIVIATIEPEPRQWPTVSRT